jgi:transposase InsO family protein
MHPNEKQGQAVQFFRTAVAHYAKLGVTVKRLQTDNSSALHSRDFGQACRTLSIKDKFTRADRPQANGKAERFIHLALREWADDWTYLKSAQRTEALADWQHHYNGHRPRSGVGDLTSMSRLRSSKSNLSALYN